MGFFNKYGNNLNYDIISKHYADIWSILTSFILNVCLIIDEFRSNGQQQIFVIFYSFNSIRNSQFASSTCVSQLYIYNCHWQPFSTRNFLRRVASCIVTEKFGIVFLKINCWIESSGLNEDDIIRITYKFGLKAERREKLTSTHYFFRGK